MINCKLWQSASAPLFLLPVSQTLLPWWRSSNQQAALTCRVYFCVCRDERWSQLFTLRWQQTAFIWMVLRDCSVALAASYLGCVSSIRACKAEDFSVTEEHCGSTLRLHAEAARSANTVDVHVRRLWSEPWCYRVSRDAMEWAVMLWSDAMEWAVMLWSDAMEWAVRSCVEQDDAVKPFRGRRRVGQFLNRSFLYFELKLSWICFLSFHLKENWTELNWTELSSSPNELNTSLKLNYFVWCL